MSKNAEWNPLFDGYYGMRNTGDDVFCTIAAWGARRYWNARRIRFAASQLPVMPESVVPLVPQAILQGKPLFRGYVFSLFNLIYCSIYLANSSGIVYAGGSTLLDIPHAKHILGLATRLLSKPLAGIGLSLGPFQTQRGRQRVADFLQQFSFLTLRDRASYEEANGMSLPCTPVQAFDLAGLLPAVYEPLHWRGTAMERLTLGLGLGHSAPYNTAKEERVKDTLIRLAKHENIKIRFCIFNGHPLYGDLRLAKRMAAALKPFCPVEIVSYTKDPGQMWRRVAECDAFLAERLHSAIFAYMAHVPFAIVEYHRKCADLADDIGLPEIYRFSDAGPDPTAAVEVLSSLLHAPRFAKMAPQEAQARAELNFVNAPWCVREAQYQSLKGRVHSPGGPSRPGLQDGLPTIRRQHRH